MTVTRIIDEDDDSNGSGSARGTTVMPSGRTGTTIVQPEGFDDIRPVVGWLVIIDGPGRGVSLSLHHGMSSIGRSEDNVISLNFGDEAISNKDHFRIVYDRKHRNFHILPSDGSNLVYMEDEQPLLAAQFLNNQQTLTVGKTQLKFVAFCSKEWDWDFESEKTIRNI